MIDSLDVVRIAVGLGLISRVIAWFGDDKFMLNYVDERLHLFRLPLVASWLPRISPNALYSLLELLFFLGGLIALGRPFYRASAVLSAAAFGLVFFQDQLWYTDGDWAMLSCLVLLAAAPGPSGRRAGSTVSWRCQAHGWFVAMVCSVFVYTGLNSKLLLWVDVASNSASPAALLVGALFDWSLPAVYGAWMLAPLPMMRSAVGRRLGVALLVGLLLLHAFFSPQYPWFLLLSATVLLGRRWPEQLREHAMLVADEDQTTEEDEEQEGGGGGWRLPASSLVALLALGPLLVLPARPLLWWASGTAVMDPSSDIAKLAPAGCTMPSQWVGLNFAWHWNSADKDSVVTLFTGDDAEHADDVVEGEFFSLQQLARLANYPALLFELGPIAAAHVLEAARASNKDPEVVPRLQMVRAVAVAAYGQRMPQFVVDPRVDLATATYSPDLLVPMLPGHLVEHALIPVATQLTQEKTERLYHMFSELELHDAIRMWDRPLRKLNQSSAAVI